MVTNELKDRGRISELGDRTIEITQFEQQRGDRMKKKEQKLRGLWEYNRRSNIYDPQTGRRERKMVLKNC